MPVTKQGVNLDRYMLVPRTLVILTRDENVLLLKGADDKRLWAGLYNGIGGHVERGEDIRSAAKRELFEETGITQVDLWLCGIVTVDTQINPGVCIFIYKGIFPSGIPLASNEGTLEWIHHSEIASKPLVPDLPWILAKVFQYDPGDEIFFAHSNYDASGNLVIKFM